MSPLNCWINLSGECLESPPENKYGFIYLITNNLNGRIYVGKKAFTHSRKTRLSKKARVGTRKRVEIKKVDSKWLSYYGSSVELLADIKTNGAEHFTRTVLAFCDNKTQLNYWEAHYQFHYRVLLTDSYNKWISVKSYKIRL